MLKSLESALFTQLTVLDLALGVISNDGAEMLAAAVLDRVECQDLSQKGLSEQAMEHLAQAFPADTDRLSDSEME